MAMGADEGECRRLLQEHGTFVRSAKHGEWWRVGQTVILPTHDVGPRDWKNNLARIARMLRAEGLIKDELRETEKEEAVQKVEEKLDSLEALGIHVARQRVVVEKLEVVISGEAILAGLKLGPLEGLRNVVVRDVTGKVVEGPFQIEAECLTEEA